jgi:hypothetical protein
VVKAKAKAKPAKTSLTASKPPARAPKSTRVTTKLPPAPPGPPPPPPARDELDSPRDIGRLTRYGERFGAHKIDVRMWPAPGVVPPAQLSLPSGSLAIFDPSAPKSWKVFDRPVNAGQFRIMLSVDACEGKPERLAAIVIHMGRPPITKWAVAHWKGQQKPKSADDLPRATVTNGWLALTDGGSGSPGVLALPPSSGILPVEVPLTDGRRAFAFPCANGDYAAYWAVDASDKPICFVVDFDVFTKSDWKAKPPT